MTRIVCTVRTAWKLLPLLAFVHLAKDRERRCPRLELGNTNSTNSSAHLAEPKSDIAKRWAAHRFDQFVIIQSRKKTEKSVCPWLLTEGEMKMNTKNKRYDDSSSEFSEWLLVNDSVHWSQLVDVIVNWVRDDKKLSEGGQDWESSLSSSSPSVVLHNRFYDDNSKDRKYIKVGETFRLKNNNEALTLWSKWQASKHKTTLSNSFSPNAARQTRIQAIRRKDN